MNDGINILMVWGYDIHSQYLFKMFDELNVVSCSYLYDKQEDIIDNPKFKPIYIYSGLEFYKNQEFEYELDDDILRKFAPYERTAMEIVNRWHRSFISSDSYASIRETSFIFLRFWYDYIKKNNINFLVIDTLPHIPAEFFPYALCKCLDIPVIIQGILPLSAHEKTTYILQPGATEFDANFDSRYSEAKKKFEDIDDYHQIPLRKEFERYFEQYDPNAKSEKRVIFYNKKDSLNQKISAYTDRIKIYAKRKDYKVLIKKAEYLVKTRSETRGFLKKVEELEEQPDTSKKFYIFGLHLQPEATTLPAGGVYNDQLLAIRLLSQCIPDDTYLYVKEHPAYWKQKGRLESVYESRSLEFYREIKKLRNVKLINHKVSSKELINKCVAVVTVTGTIGFEALFRGKPVLCFGETFYSKYPSVFRIHTVEECKEATNLIANTNFSFNPKDLAIYLYASQKYAIPMGMCEKEFLDNGIPGVDDGDRKRLTEKIVEFYQEYYSAR